jgi:hypothetical protein
MSLLIKTDTTVNPSDIAWGLNLIRTGTGDPEPAQINLGYSFGAFRFGGTSTPGGAVLGIPANSTTYFLVARIDMTARLLHVWVNPTPGPTAPSDASAVVPLGSPVTPFTFNAVRFAGFGTAAGKEMDEIRIGKTFSQVAPSNFVPNGLQAFRIANSLAADGSQDGLNPSGDGVASILKFAFNMIGTGVGQKPTLAEANGATLNPVSGTAGLPVVGLDGSGRLTITYIRSIALPAPGISYAVQFKTAVSDPTWAVNPSATESITPINASYERVVVTDSIVANPSRFVRVQVTAN